MIDIIFIKNLVQENSEKSNKILKNYIRTLENKVYEITYENGENLLHMCLKNQNIEFCDFLINEIGFIPDIGNSEYITPIFYSMSADSSLIECLKILLRNKCDIYYKNLLCNINIIDFSKKIGIYNDIKDLLDYNESLIPAEINKNVHFVKPGYNLYQVQQYIITRRMQLVLTEKFLELNNNYSNGMIVPEVKKIKNFINNYKDFYEIKEEYLKQRDKYFRCMENNISFNFNRCLNCDKTDNVLRCSKCKQVYFCNRKCQKKSFEIHKKYCM